MKIGILEGGSFELLDGMTLVDVKLRVQLGTYMDARSTRLAVVVFPMKCRIGPTE